jgi:hypothetical protein
VILIEPTEIIEEQQRDVAVGSWSSQVPLPSRLIERFSFGGPTI